MTAYFNWPEEFLNRDLTTIREQASACQRCGLCETRQQVVFGQGPVPCDIMLIGEAPGADEDEQGIPFVGRAGQLLSKILESVDIKRPTDIYIANTIKCRPPDNRVPTPAETLACAPWLSAQLLIVKPKILLLAGTPALKAILSEQLADKETISKVRGRWFKLPVPYMDEPLFVMPLFHPSYLLHNPSKEPGSPKALMWQDVKEVRGALDFIRKVKSPDVILANAGIQGGAAGTGFPLARE